MHRHFVLFGFSIQLLLAVGCSEAHSEACVSHTIGACRCPGLPPGTMQCVDGLFRPCLCPEPCDRPSFGDSCTCRYDLGAGRRGRKVCQEDLYWSPCSCETFGPTPCTLGQRAPCQCATGSASWATGWATCGDDGVYEACDCVEPDGGWPCRPQTCEELEVLCGPASDGCGGTLDCGPCVVRM